MRRGNALVILNCAPRSNRSTCEVQPRYIPETDPPTPTFCLGWLAWSIPITRAPRKSFIYVMPTGWLVKRHAFGLKKPPLTLDELLGFCTAFFKIALLPIH